MWKLTMYKVDNGFRVDADNGDGTTTSVYQEREGLEENKEHIVEMLYDVLMFFGELGSKHDKKRLKVTWEKP